MFFHTKITKALNITIIKYKYQHKAFECLYEGFIKDFFHWHWWRKACDFRGFIGQYKKKKIQLEMYEIILKCAHAGLDVHAKSFTFYTAEWF